MGYTLKIEEKPGYVHFAVHGETDPQTVGNFLRDISVICRERKYSTILIEEDLKGQSISPTNVYEIISSEAKKLPPLLNCIAYVDANPEHQNELMHFAETVAVNRGVNIKVFFDTQDAINWLRSLE